MKTTLKLGFKKSKNTISCYMRSLRAAYNRAAAEKIFIPDRFENPFSDVFTGYAKTPKRAISEESILKIKNLSPNLSPQGRGTAPLSCGEGSGERQSRDLFLFSFYTQGMSFADMANLKEENIKCGFIRYNRKKTGQQITVVLEDCMREIIERYSDSNSKYIFPILRDVENCKESVKWEKTCSALAKYNKSLKKIARLTKIEEHVTSYSARHSWASFASQEGIPIAIISKGMGHESEKTTRIYISQLDYSDLKEANRKILVRFTKNVFTDAKNQNQNAGKNVE